MRRVRVEAGVGVVVVVALAALAAVSFQGHEEPSAQSRLSSSRVPHLLLSAFVLGAGGKPARR